LELHRDTASDSADVQSVETLDQQEMEAADVDAVEKLDDIEPVLRRLVEQDVASQHARSESVSLSSCDVALSQDSFSISASILFSTANSSWCSLAINAFSEARAL